MRSSVGLFPAPWQHYHQSAAPYLRFSSRLLTATLDAAEDSFQQSDLLKELKARSEANKDQRTKELRDKYCKRQAELGVGDCAGLRLIPGMTKSGVQKRPEWLDKLVYGDSPPE